jgi:hypothetical protein
MLEYLAPGFIYSVLKDAASAISRWRHKLTASEIVDLRNKWKPLFENKIRDNYRENLRRDVVVRDMKRVDNYPEAKEGKGISPWFRVGLVGTYHRGIVLALRWETPTRDRDGPHWRATNYARGESGDLKVILLGNVPYEYIENVDWGGDEFYPFPHIYCYFRHRGEPYEHLGFYSENTNPGGLPYYTEVVSYRDLRKVCSKP